MEYKNLKVVELREQLSLKGLSTEVCALAESDCFEKKSETFFFFFKRLKLQGKKAELIQRLQEAENSTKDPVSNEAEAEAEPESPPANKSAFQFPQNTFFRTYYDLNLRFCLGKRKATEEPEAEASKPKKQAVESTSAQEIPDLKVPPQFALPTFSSPPKGGLPVPAEVSFAPISFSPFSFGPASPAAAKPNGDNDLIELTKKKGTTYISVQRKALTKVGMASLVELLQSKESKVQTLMISETEMDNETFSLLLDGLKTNSSVETLNLSQASVLSTSWESFIEVFTTNHTIKTLSLDMTGDKAAIVAARLLKMESCAITDLSIKACRIYDETLASCEFADALRGNKTLTALELSDNMLTHVAVETIAEALKSNTALKKLGLACMDVGPQGCKALGDMLKENSSLTELLMYGARGGAEGMIALATALLTNTTLRRISMPAWYASNTAGKAICEVISTNKTIEYMDLRRNDFNDAVASDLAEALKINRSLSSIEFENNGFTEVGAKLFAEALQVNMTTRVILYGCPIKPQLKNKLKNSVEGNRLVLS